MEKEYSFKTALDSSVLEDFYEGDLGYALSMFELFNEQIPLEISTLQEALSKGDLEGCRRVLHKIKPNFVMVGNSPLSEFCTKIERDIKVGLINFDQAKPEIESIIEEIQETLILLKEETAQLKQHLNQ
ncbi:Hpt domain-containing protein [Phaeocystidibacter luteus]|uniref:Hpt domain-containing protein n=1 Tax=Phaeocystidibacter luteus TaxID=911197 RepID=A0A6N6RIM8_9FLAO|nr:Hpt domain-containing protein [Phaeocystidibacter luteus]KAB2814203.1 Hpt domain-containing protein [Phaeocystidibacter luteus]